MSALELQVYEIFKTKFSEASRVIEYFEAKYIEKRDILAIKEDLASTKVEIIKWMIGTGIAIVGLLSGVMFTLLSAYLKH